MVRPVRRVLRESPGRRGAQELRGRQELQGLSGPLAHLVLREWPESPGLWARLALQVLQVLPGSRERPVRWARLAPLGLPDRRGRPGREGLQG